MKVSDKKKRAIVGLMFKSVSKRDWLTMRRARNQRIRAYLAKLDTIIAKYGYYVQVVNDGEHSFAYSCGRNYKGKPDFVAREHVSQATTTLINEIAERYDKGGMCLDVEYESNILVTAEDQDVHTKYKLVEANLDYWRTRALGVFRRFCGDGELSLIEIIIPDRNNNFKGETNG